MFKKGYTEKGQDANHSLYSGSGQAALIVLLMSAVVLTIGLATTARTVTDIKISSQLEESAKALSAAEAGIERGLTGGSCNVTAAELDNVASAACTVCNLGVDNCGLGAGNYTFGTVEKGDVRTIWFVDHDASGNPQISGSRYNDSLTVNWSANIVSLEFIIIDRNNKVIRHYESGGSRNFSTGGNWILLRVRPVTDSATISVSPGSAANFKSQGKKIVSTGKTTSGVSRKIEVTRWYPEPSGIMDYVMYSNSNLQK